MYKYCDTQSRNYTRNTLVSMQKYPYTIIAENSGEAQKKQSKRGSNLLKIYKKTYIYSSNEIVFKCLRTMQLHAPVAKLALNQENDILIVSFENGEVRIFFIEEKRQALDNAKFAKSIEFEEIRTSIDESSVYSPGAICVARLDLQEISNRMFEKKNKFVYVSRELPMSRNKEKPECLILYNRVKNSLEIFSIADPDDIRLSVRFQISNLCSVSRIGYLEKDWLVLGGRVHGSSSHKKNLLLFDPLNFKFVEFGWKELVDVSELLYHRDSRMLFVAVQNKYFAVFYFNLKDSFLEKIGLFSPDLRNSGQLSFLLMSNYQRSKNKPLRNLLFISNGSNRLYTYKIDSKGGLVPQVTFRETTDSVQFCLH